MSTHKSSFDLEPNPFERSFAEKDKKPTINSGSPPILTPGGRRLPPLMSPSNLSNPGTPGSLWNSLLNVTSTNQNPNGNANANGNGNNVSNFLNTLRKTGLTPNESNLRSGLTPGYMGSIQLPGINTPGNGAITPGLSSLLAGISNHNSINSMNSNSINQSGNHSSNTDVSLNFDSGLLNSIDSNKLNLNMNNLQSLQNLQNLGIPNVQNLPNGSNVSNVTNVSNVPNGSNVPNVQNVPNGTQIQNPNVPSIPTVQTISNVPNLQNISAHNAQNLQHHNPNFQNNIQNGVNNPSKTHSSHHTSISSTNSNSMSNLQNMEEASMKRDAEIQEFTQKRQKLNREEENENEVIKRNEKRSKNMTEDEKRKNFLERNRVAASKCRQRKKQLVQKMEDELNFYSTGYRDLSSQVNTLREQVLTLRTLLYSHKDCPTLIDNVGGYETLNSILNSTNYASQLPQNVIPPNEISDQVSTAQVVAAATNNMLSQQNI